MNILRVLIVEDHPATAELLCKWVESAGHQFQLARTGFQALQAAPKFEPQVVLLDIGLPDMDGWELAKEMRQAPGLNDPKIIAVTAFQTSEDRQKSKQAGIDYHLGKPVSKNEILAMLTQASE
jgi:CheY-like chemotaxis protein